MRADAVNSFQMLRVHDQAGELILVQLKTEQNAQAHIVDAAFHRAVHGFRVVIVVVLGACGMEMFVALLVVGLLEEDIGADPGLLELPVILHRRRRDIDIDSSDVAVLVMDAVDRFDTVQNVVDRVVHRIFAGFDRQPFVAHILQRDHFRADFFLRQFLARDGLVLEVVGTVQAAVDAVVRQIQRGEQHDTVPVIRLLDLPGDLEHFLNTLRILACEKHRSLAVGECGPMLRGRQIARPRLLQDRVDQFKIVLVGLRVGEGLLNLGIVDELVRDQGFGVVFVRCAHFYFLSSFMGRSSGNDSLHAVAHEAHASRS